MSQETEVIELKDALKSTPLCTGVYTPTSREDFIVFYSGKNHPERIDLASASVPQLVQLLSSSTPLGEEDVLGEGFRKAGKLGEFATKFDPARSGILHIATKELLDVEKGEVDAELDGFYVYGKGSSVHIKSVNLGTLFIVFPTVYEGDNFAVFKENDKWSFDPAKALTKAPSPSVVYVATSSDISLDVSAGHLCMLVYRIIAKPNYIGMSPIYEVEEKFKTVMSTLLADSNFFPDGGFLRFELTHSYPNVVGKNSVKGLKKKLVGYDNLVQRVCRDLALKVLVRVMYDEDPDEPIIMLKEPADLTDWCGAAWEEHAVEALKFEGGVDMDETDIRWGKRAQNIKNGQVETSFSGGGHKPTVCPLYGWVCLMVEIPNATARVEGGGLMEQGDSSDDE